MAFYFGNEVLLLYSIYSGKIGKRKFAQYLNTYQTHTALVVGVHLK